MSLPQRRDRSGSGDDDYDDDDLEDVGFFRFCDREKPKTKPMIDDGDDDDAEGHDADKDHEDHEDVDDEEEECCDEDEFVDDASDKTYNSSDSDEYYNANSSDDDDDSSLDEEAMIKKQRKLTESKIGAKVKRILDDPEKCKQVKDQLENVLQQADVYSEFLEQQVGEALCEEDDENYNSNNNNDDQAASSVSPTTTGGEQKQNTAANKTVFQPPEGCSLFPHQTHAVRWLTSIFCNGVNAILSDEMGLGKTIEIVGFLCKLFSERIVGPHLLIVPLSTIQNWAREWQRWAPSVRVLVLHGGRDDYPGLFERIATDFRPPYSDEEKMETPLPVLMKKCGGVVLTSFEVAMRNSTTLAGMPARWREACTKAYEKNQQQQQQRSSPRTPTTTTTTTSRQLKAHQKLQVGHITSWGVLVVDEAHRLKNFQCLLIQQIRSVPATSRVLLTGTPMHNRLTELWSILHFIVPELFKSVVNFRVWFGVSDELVRTTCRFQDVVCGGDDVDEATRKQEAAENTAAQQQQQQQDPTSDELLMLEENNEEELEKQLKLQKQAARRSTKNQRGLMNKTKTVSEAAVFQQSEAEAVDVVAKMHRILRPFMLRRTKNELPELKLPKKIEVNVRCPLAPYQQEVYDIVRNDVTGKYATAALTNLRLAASHPYLVGKKGEFERHAKYLRKYDGDLQFGGKQKYRTRYVNDLLKDSTKINVALNILPGLRMDGHVVLIFSQFTLVLDALAELLDAYRAGDIMLGGQTGGGGGGCSLSYRRLQGGQNIDDRNEQLSDFLDPEKDIAVFLVSTRSGGVGLNLARADTVIMMDPDFNPHNDMQAIDRCHRIGQTRPVVVMRFFCNKTVEEAILEMCTHKLRLEGLVIGAGKYNAGGSKQQTTITTKEEVSSAVTKTEVTMEGEQQQRQQQAVEQEETAASSSASASASERKAEAAAIRSSLSRLKRMVLADFSLQKEAAATSSSAAQHPDAAAPAAAAAASSSGAASGTNNNTAADKKNNDDEGDDDAGDFGELLRYVPSAVGTGHWVFHVDAADPTWGLDMLVGVPRF